MEYRGVHLFLVLVLATLTEYLTNGQQCEQFPQIDEDDYDLSYHLITESNSRPLGFKRYTQFHSASIGNTKPCISADELAGGRQVEIMYETVPGSTLCLRVKGGTPDEDFGCSEKFQTCLISNTDTIEFEFYCGINYGCSESNVNFWARVTTGDVPADDPEGMWCHDRDSLYPESLAQRPAFITPGPTEPTQAADHSTLSLTAVIISLITSVLIMNF